MKINIEEIPESRIAYFRNVGEYGEKQNKELMESFKKWAQTNDVFDNSTILGIPQDNPQVTPKEECRYDVCVVINNDFNVVKPAQAATPVRKSILPVAGTGMSVNRRKICRLRFI